MNKDCSQLVEIINGLFADIEKTKNIWGGIRGLNPDFEQVSAQSCHEREALLWLHGETHPFEAHPLEEWLFAAPPITKTSISPAVNHYSEWCEHILENGVYADFEEDDLPEPEPNETLNDYIVRLSEKVESQGQGKKKEKRALNSFLNHLREVNEQEEIAFIEYIFPQKRDLRGGRIIRKIRPQVHPIPKEVAAAIIKDLAFQCANGRKNAQHHAGEALALSWLCLSAARIRWPRTLESVHATERSSLIFQKDYPAFLVPSIFGPHAVRIGKRVDKFLRAVGDIPSENSRSTILQTPLSDLRKPFNAALKRVNPDPSLGEITFLSFLSEPHHFGEHIR